MYFVFLFFTVYLKEIIYFTRLILNVYHIYSTEMQALIIKPKVYYNVDDS